jgi:hypothetical protein
MDRIVKTTRNHSLAEEETKIIPFEPEIEFPKDSFSGPMKEMAEAVSTTFRIDPPVAYAPALATVSAAMGKSYYVSNGSNHPPAPGNLFVLVSAPSSSGKGVTCGSILKPLKKWDQELDEAYLKEVPKRKAKLDFLNAKKKRIASRGKSESGSGKSKGSELLDELNEIESKIFNLSKDGKTLRELPPLYVENISSEALAHNLELANGALFSMSAEASDLIAIAKGRYSDKGNDFAVYLKGFSGDPLDFHRIGRARVKVLEPRLSLLWMAQPSVVKELIGDKGASLQGLNGRFLYFLGEALLEPEDGEPRQLSADVVSSWNQSIKKILEFRQQSKEPLIVPCTSDARAVFLKFHNDINEKMRNGEMPYEDELGKGRELAIRTALCIAVVGDKNAKPKEVTESDAKKAVEIVAWCQVNLIKEIRGYRIKSLADIAHRLEKLLSEDYRGEWMAIRDLQNAHGIHHSETKQIAECRKDTFETRRVLPDNQRKGGRPSLEIRWRG